MLSNNLGSFETARSGLDYESYSETLVFEVSYIFIYHISRLYCYCTAEWTNRAIHYSTCAG